ncbi:MAG: hypothetical protein BAJALOKI1v1_1340002 [Promethearchaeota archaeon]|nr:MAG: hypothetical protein BAJALOKI1v1_1340002 [Candidatus Lokiarchaeota archaeon]
MNKDLIGGEFLWAIGGRIENKYALKDTTVYHIDVDEWYSSQNGELAPMSHAVQGAGWTFFCNKIYCFGAKTKPHKGCSPYLQVYDIEENEWQLYDKMPKPRSKLGKHYPVIDDQYVYFFGGDDEHGPASRVNWNWRYYLVNDEWDTTVGDAPYTQSFPLPTFHKGWIYYSTGNTGNDPEQNIYRGALNQRYNPKTDTWEVMTPCPIPTTDGSGDKWQEELHFIGAGILMKCFIIQKFQIIMVP